MGRHADVQTRSTHFRSASLNLGTRALVLPLSALTSVEATRIIAKRYHSEGFGLYALVSALPLLIPAADLGIGTEITDVVARRTQIARDTVRAVLRRALLKLTAVAVAIAAAAVILNILGAWGPLLGLNSDSASSGATVALVSFAVSMPAAVGLRALQGLERAHVATALQLIGSFASLAVVTFVAGFGLPLWALCGAPSVGTASAGVLAWYLSRPELRRDAAGVRAPPTDHNAQSNIAGLAGPAIVIALSLPVAFQTDRLVISHFGTVHEVARYSAGSLLYLPILSIITAAGQGVWPVFSRQRSQGIEIPPHKFYKLFTLFALFGGAGGLGLGILGGPVSKFITHNVTSAPRELMWAFATLLFVFALQNPGAMAMMDRQGLLFQAKLCALMALVNVPVSIGLYLVMGISGPVWASAITVGTINTFPTFVALKRRLLEASPPAYGAR